MYNECIRPSTFSLIMNQNANILKSIDLFKGPTTATTTTASSTNARSTTKTLHRRTKTSNKCRRRTKTSIKCRTIIMTTITEERRNEATEDISTKLKLLSQKNFRNKLFDRFDKFVKLVSFWEREVIKIKLWNWTPHKTTLAGLLKLGA